MLGANGWQTLWRVTLPNIKWGLLYGILLCNGRAIGEFGAVAVVSGHIAGLTNTMPLHVEVLYNDYAFAAAFAVASLLTLMALATLAIEERARMARRGRASRAAGRIRRIVALRIEVEAAHQAISRRRSCSIASISRSASASSWACSARPARARPRCCASSPASSFPIPGDVLIDGEDALSLGFARAPDRLRVPALRAVQSHDRIRERRVRAEGAPAPQASAARRDRRARERIARPRPARRISRNAFPRSSPAASASASRWRARSRPSRRCCCSTSRSARSTPRCGSSCAARCATSTTPPG